MRADDELAFYTVYSNPGDYPGRFVARRTVLRTDAARDVVVQHVDVAPYVVCEALEVLRALLPPGLSRLERQEADDPVIVEVWV